MKRTAFLALAIMFACCSCNSQRRAARRITRIAEHEHRKSGRLIGFAIIAATITTLILLIRKKRR